METAADFLEAEILWVVNDRVAQPQFQGSEFQWAKCLFMMMFQLSSTERWLIKPNHMDAGVQHIHLNTSYYYHPNFLHIYSICFWYLIDLIKI